MEQLQNQCKKCLIYEMAEKESYQNMYQYINQLDEEIRTEESRYQHRLMICRECDNLFNGMCKLCGCFVEMRAAVNTNYCPDLVQKW